MYKITLRVGFSTYLNIWLCYLVQYVRKTVFLQYVNIPYIFTPLNIKVQLFQKHVCILTLTSFFFSIDRKISTSLFLSCKRKHFVVLKIKISLQMFDRAINFKKDFIEFKCKCMDNGQIAQLNLERLLLYIFTIGSNILRLFKITKNNI